MPLETLAPLSNQNGEKLERTGFFCISTHKKVTHFDEVTQKIALGNFLGNQIFGVITPFIGINIYRLPSYPKNR